MATEKEKILAVKMLIEKADKEIQTLFAKGQYSAGENKHAFKSGLEIALVIFTGKID